MKFDHGVLAVGCSTVSQLDGKKFVAETFEKSSDTCPRRSVLTRHIDGHCGRLLRLPVSFQAHCDVLTFLVLSVTYV